MSLPIRTTLEDVKSLCNYFTKKPTGASIKEAKKVLDKKLLSGLKINALKYWKLIEEKKDKIKITDLGRKIVKDSESEIQAYKTIIKSTKPYDAIIERVGHKNETQISATDVAAHWHEHFSSETSDSERILNDQAVCFFQIIVGAKLGKLIVGRREQSTRIEFKEEDLMDYIEDVDTVSTGDESVDSTSEEEPEDVKDDLGDDAGKEFDKKKQLGQGIFIAHGKNKKPLDQLKKILDQFKIPYKVAIEEPNLGRPIGTKVREIMEGCNCAILIFTEDEELKNKEGDTIWRPSENVVYELGASGYLYDKRIVIMKEDGVQFPTNFRDLGYISFQKESLDAKAMDIIKELIGFGIVKVST